MSYDPFNIHENGKSHKKHQKQLLTQQDPNLRRQLVQQHLNEPRGIFIEQSLENMIDSMELNVLCVQFVYSYIRDDSQTYLAIKNVVTLDFQGSPWKIHGLQCKIL